MLRSTLVMILDGWACVTAAILALGWWVNR